MLLINFMPIHATKFHTVGLSSHKYETHTYVVNKNIGCYILGILSACRVDHDLDRFIRNFSIKSQLIENFLFLFAIVLGNKVLQ